MLIHEMGALLIDDGLLKPKQVDAILESQRQHDDFISFNALTAELFDLDEIEVYDTLARRVETKCERVNLITEEFDPGTLELIPARDAWNHLVLPLRKENGRLVCATAIETLAESIAFVHQAVQRPFDFVIAECRPLEQFIAQRYSYEGIEC